MPVYPHHRKPEKQRPFSRIPLLIFGIISLIAFFSIHASIFLVLRPAERNKDTTAHSVHSASHSLFSKRKRKPIFFHHISKAGGTYINRLAIRNGEVTSNLRWQGQGGLCRFLTDCPSNVTFVQFEQGLGSLTNAEREILFPREGESAWLTLVQIRNPMDLEASWFKEIKYGYKDPKVQNATFLQYTEGFKDLPLRRMHSILMFLGSDKVFGELEDIDTSMHTALSNLHKFDLVTTTEERDHAKEIFKWALSWTDFDDQGPSRVGHHMQDMKLSSEAKARLKATLEPDEKVYACGLNISRHVWLKWVRDTTA